MSSTNVSNSTPVSSCMYSSIWSQKDLWTSNDEMSTTQITAPDVRGIMKLSTLRERNTKRQQCYKHVPHKDKPPQVVARRNARERRRVQAVNSAFMRLRKAVPIENSRGKRISKVKTLQYAIEYIRSLARMLEQDHSFQLMQPMYSSYKTEEFLYNLDFGEDEM